MAVSTQRPPARSSFRGVHAALLVLAALLGACGEQEKPVTKAAGKTSSPAAPGATKGPKGEQPAKKTEDIATLAYQQALTLLLKGEPEQAEAELQRAVTLNPRMSEGYFELGKLGLHLSSRRLAADGRDAAALEKGLAALTKAVEIEPNNDEYLFWLARGYSLKSDRATAIQYLEKALQLNPKNGQAWRRLGLEHVQDGRIEQARDCFAKSVELFPKDAGGHFQLGKTLEALGDTAGARAAYEKAIELDVTDPMFHDQLAQLLRKLGDEEGATRAEQGRSEWEGYAAKLDRRMKAVNQRPNDADALRRLGEMYYDVGKWSEALEWFLKAINVNPKDALAHLYCGSVRRHLQEYDVASNHLKEAEFLAPDSLEPKLELLRLYADMGQLESLTTLVSSVETSAAANGEWLYTLGTTCAELGRADDAARLLEKAKALGVTGPPEESAAPAEGQ